MEVMGGYEKATTDSVQGICRGQHSWCDDGGLCYGALGTHTYLQAYHDGELYDITPYDPANPYGRLTNPFSTTASSTTVNVADTAHGRTEGSRVIFANASAVSDVTVDGEYTVDSVVDANNYEITVSSAAAATAGPGGGTVDYEYLLPIGLEDSIGGPGYGVGTFGSGTYAATSTETNFLACTWSLDNWGHNLVACPRGGYIYEWAPLFTQTELVTNGTFATNSDWTKGIGWTIGSGVATGAAGTDSDLEQAITLTRGAYHFVEMDLTVTAGELQPFIGTTAITGVQPGNIHIKAVVFYASGNLIINKDAAGAGTVDNVTVKQMLRASPIPNAPTMNTVVWVTAERVLVAAGTIEASTSLYNPLHIRGCDQEDNQDWTPSALNTSFGRTLAGGSRFISAQKGRAENGVWTDIGLYIMRFVPDTNVVYRFDLVGTGCGPIGANATVVLNGVYYWMAAAGDFFRYVGGVPEPLLSPVRKDVFDNLAPGQAEKVFAFSNSAFGEFGFLIPDFREASPNECNSYVVVNVAENAYATGTVDRTAWLDNSGLGFPTAVSAAGSFYYQEKGRSFDGGLLKWMLKTGALEIADGEKLMRVLGLIPDFDDFVGGCKVTISAFLLPNSPAVTQSKDITSATTKADFLLVGGQIQITFEGDAAPAFMRTGQVRLDVVQTTMTR